MEQQQRRGGGGRRGGEGRGGRGEGRGGGRGRGGGGGERGGGWSRGRGGAPRRDGGGGEGGGAEAAAASGGHFSAASPTSTGSERGGRGRGRGSRGRRDDGQQDTPIIVRPAPSPLVDIGANLAHASFRSDFTAILERAQNANVRSIVITGTSERASKEAFRITKSHEGFLYSTAGVHPHDAKSCNERTIANLRELLKHKSVVAVGECGLDFDRNFSPQDVQEKWFIEQLNLAKETGKPLFLHERSAFTRFVEIMKEHADGLPPAVVHCFTGTKEELEEYLAMGLYIGITGWVCDERRGRHLQEIVSMIPLDRLMIETDAPFLTPRTLRPCPRRNEPSYLPIVLETLADCMGVSIDELARETTRTAAHFFGLPN